MHPRKIGGNSRFVIANNLMKISHYVAKYPRVSRLVLIVEI